MSKDVNVEDTRDRHERPPPTNKWGQSATREREVEGQGGYATIEAQREDEHGARGRRPTSWPGARSTAGRPWAGSVDTKYNGNYNVAAGRNAYGGWNTAVAGPYGGKVTRTLPSGYRYHLLRPALLLVRWRVLSAV